MFLTTPRRNRGLKLSFLRRKSSSPVSGHFPATFILFKVIDGLPW
ncbi:hypothetical protein RchiOBHm_Chr2g0144561 [Rosa chinensis]|uniref:Uncharacterized protein n=1 Tax=Rosa chinensis TaxID=74649 RepID=A0A2P6RYD5_ROSCH|nr:hypothetical protein RchiOBHm_Chr2g0144561 [Rosa chinensis]